ncbi:thiamine phosphate synthase [Lutibaculum baratangense]|uniref:Thiamine-phosphate synthase n=1 Tax=Lutibaculum baratangense AMV1 TaxID=631454 RepID=V4QZU6_9HYPH|nr:thiamine phosphate synthase [Lutibaculum baratangense]ESR25287.1 Thiamin-phosphate pyrophosphorylase [Lutibaculum baratangense AMV1]
MLDPFYLIVDDAAWLERLLPQGLKFAQLRVKERAEEDVWAQVHRAKQLCDAAGATLVVNDYWRIAVEEGCDWVHLGQEDLDTADLEAIRRAGVKLGISTHDHAELDRALAAKPDYVALGPVFPTVLKAMTFAPQGLERLGEWKRLIGDIPLVAIGGLTPERARQALAAGADCTAVVTDVLRHADPEARTREWIEATRAAA